MTSLWRWFEERGRRKAVLSVVAAGLTLGLLLAWLGTVTGIALVGACALISISWITRRGGLPSNAGAAAGPATVQAHEGSEQSEGTSRLLPVEEGELIGSFDNDGHLTEGTAPKMSRYRYDLDLVSHREGPLVRKDYRGRSLPCKREARALERLGGRVNAPFLVFSDPRSHRIFKRFVPGQTLREILVERGARILTEQTCDEVVLAGLEPLARLEAIWQRGRETLMSMAAVGSFEGSGRAFIHRLEQEMDRIHRLGVTGFSLTFGNVVVHEDGGDPWFIDFDSAQTSDDLSSTSFRMRRDRDRRWFDRIYGAELMTEKGARQSLSQSLATSYSPVDFGWGLTTRGFWSTDSGSGRWVRWNRDIMAESIRGRRVLDLGSHNAVMPLMMLRSGARQVTAVERDPKALEVARGLLEIAKWHDMADYRLDLRQAEILEFVRTHDGEYDVATALCSLYYLPEDEMREVVRRLSRQVPRMILQAKTDTAVGAADDKARKSSLEFSRSLLHENGFPEVEVFTARGWSRPILIGRREVDP